MVCGSCSHGCAKSSGAVRGPTQFALLRHKFVHPDSPFAVNERFWNSNDVRKWGVGSRVTAHAFAGITFENFFCCVETPHCVGGRCRPLCCCATRNRFIGCSWQNWVVGDCHGYGARSCRNGDFVCRAHNVGHSRIGDCCLTVTIRHSGAGSRNERRSNRVPLRCARRLNDNGRSDWENNCCVGASCIDCRSSGWVNVDGIRALVHDVNDVSHVCGRDCGQFDTRIGCCCRHNHIGCGQCRCC